jgi:hypothetical protein
VLDEGGGVVVAGWPVVVASVVVGVTDPLTAIAIAPRQACCK